MALYFGDQSVSLTSVNSGGGIDTSDSSTAVDQNMPYTWTTAFENARLVILHSF